MRRIQARAGRATETLRVNDDDLLQIDVNERSISHRLAIYLQQEFQGWHVDCEYNRDMEDPKRLQVSFDGVTDRDIDEVALNVLLPEGLDVPTVVEASRLDGGSAGGALRGIGEVILLLLSLILVAVIVIRLF